MNVDFPDPFGPACLDLARLQLSLRRHQGLQVGGQLRRQPLQQSSQARAQRGQLLWIELAPIVASVQGVVEPVQKRTFLGH